MAKINNGIIPFLYKISEKEINQMIKEYRRRNPKDIRKQIDIRPLVINEIILLKKYKPSKNEKK